MPRVIEPPRWALPTTESASGCFETMRVYGGRIFRLAQHLQRLYGSAQYLGLRLPDDPPSRPANGHSRGGRLAHRLTRALASSGFQEAVVRVALLPDERRIASPSVVVQPIQPPSPAMYARGIRVAVVPTRRFPVSQIDPQAKFSSRLGSVMAVAEAQLRRVEEALFMDALGGVTESTASNLGIIKNGVFLAPPCWLGLLVGITWQALVEVAQELKIPYRETPLTRHELYNADEAFLSSTIKEVLAITVVDGRRIGSGKPGPYTRRLHQGFCRLVKHELHG